MQHGTGNGSEAGGKGWFWMVLCCLPMIAIVVLILLARAR